MRMRLRGGYWVVDFLGPDGRRKRVSTKLTDKADAEARAAQIIVEAQRAPIGTLVALPEGGERMTLSALLHYCERTVWKGQRSETHRGFLIGRMKLAIGHWKLSEVTYAGLMGYCEGLRQEGLAPATMNRYMSTLSRAFREAEKMGWRTALPRVPRFQEPAPVERYLSVDEEERLLAAIGRRCSADRPEWIYMRALVPVLLDTGMRLSEALTLKPHDLGPGRLTLRHGGTKSGKGRHVPLTPRAEAGVILMLGSDYHGRMRTYGAYQRFVIACRDAAIEGATLHTLRHTCASRLVQAGVDLYRVKAWLGHSTIAVTERYAHLSGDSLQSAMETLAGTLGQLPAHSVGTGGTAE